MILCCGEALIDMLPRKLASGENVFLPVSGGAVFNTAITLGRLGSPAGFLSGISNDMFGQQLRDSLSDSNVDTTYCVQSDQPSTLAFVKLVDGHAHYSFMDENSAGRMLAKDDLPDVPNTVKALHFGAISLIPEPCGTAYETLMQRHCETAIISLDPNIRPGFIKDAEGHRARINRMINMSDIVKVSDEDLDWIAPETPPETAIEIMLTQNKVTVVILTKGSEGVSVFTANGQTDMSARKVKVEDTIGAGDSFNGGFLEGLRQQNLLSKSALKTANISAIKPAIDLAVTVAAITVSRTGANPPSLEDVAAFKAV